MTRAFTQLCFSPAVKDAQARYGAREQRLLENKEPANDRLNEDLKAFIGANRTLAFADYAGNQQYITLGNLAENDRIFLFLVDYEHGRRLKIWGRAAVIDDGPTLIARVRDRAYPAKIERVIRISVETWDLNCRQHLPKLIPQQRVDRMTVDCDARVATLQARYDALLAMMFIHE